MARKRGFCAALTCVLVLTVLMIGAAGCGNNGDGGNDPSSVAKAFLDGLIAHDAEATYGYLSADFTGKYGITALTWKGIMSKDPIPSEAGYTIKSEVIDGQSATVTIEPSTGGEKSMLLVNEDGEWKVQYEINEWYGLGSR